MAKQTPLHATHVAAGARMVDFAGWDMPVNYGSQIGEHHAVRRDAGMFDVSHMLALDLAGPDADGFLRGDRVVVPGPMNKLTAALGPLAPRRLVLPVVGRLQRPPSRR